MGQRTYFLCLVATQGLHSIEEFCGRIWENFPPATVLCNAVSGDPVIGFLIINIGLFVFGITAWYFVIGTRSVFARSVLWFWIAIELINGIGHPFWSFIQGGYTAGVATSPLLLIFALLLVKTSLKEQTNKRLP